MIEEPRQVIERRLLDLMKSIEAGNEKHKGDREVPARTLAAITGGRTQLEAVLERVRAARAELAEARQVYAGVLDSATRAARTGRDAVYGLYARDDKAILDYCRATRVARRRDAKTEAAETPDAN